MFISVLFVRLLAFRARRQRGNAAPVLAIRRTPFHVPSQGTWCDEALPTPFTAVSVVVCVDSGDMALHVRMPREPRMTE